MNGNMALESKLVTLPILQYPNFSKKKIIFTTDASNGSLGAILSQGEIGKDLTTAHASRS
jgi:hypothetical protein